METVLRTLGKLAMHTNTQSVADHPMNEKNVDNLCRVLVDFHFKIIRILIGSRPIKRLNHKKSNSSSFEHWTVKMEAPPILISIGFVECNKKGAFRFNQSMASDHELEDFLFYYVDAERHKLDVIASVDIKNTLNAINIKKRVCDIADFVEMWSSKRRYNPVSSNCQHFAVDLFSFLAQSACPEAVQEAISKMDTGCDTRKYKKKYKMIQHKVVEDDDDEKTMEMEMQSDDNKHHQKKSKQSTFSVL